MNVKLKRKPIPSSLREKHRYLFIELIPLKPLSLNDWEFKEVLSRHFTGFFGLKGIAFTGYQLINVNAGNLTAVLKCFQGFEDELKAALVCLGEVKGVKVIPFTKKASGTLKGLSKQ